MFFAVVAMVVVVVAVVDIEIYTGDNQRTEKEYT